MDVPFLFTTIVLVVNRRGRHQLRCRRRNTMSFELALVVDLQGSDPMKEQALAPMLVPTHLATQTEIIKSRNVALKVIEKMGLATNPEVVASFRDSGSATDLNSWLVDSLLRNVDGKNRPHQQHHPHFL